MVGTTCKDVLQVADETASKKAGCPGSMGPCGSSASSAFVSSPAASPARSRPETTARSTPNWIAPSPFPTWPSHALHAIAVVNEEIGELNKAILPIEPHKSGHEVRSEAIQAAAMAIRFVRSLDRYNYAAGEQHAQQAGGGKGGA